MDELPLLCQVARCVAYITCIAQVTTFKFVNKTLLLDKRWISFSHFKIMLNFLADEHWRHGRVNFVTQNTPKNAIILNYLFPAKVP